MLPFLLLVCVVSPVFSAEISGNDFLGFQGVFFQTIDEHLRMEFELLEPAIIRQNQSMEECKETVLQRETECRTCAERQCQGGASFFPSTFNAVSGWFQGAGNTFVDWQGWEEIGGFFEGVGNWFESSFDFSSFSSGFNNAFKDIGSSLTSGWNGFTNFMDSLGQNLGNTFSNWGNSISNTFGGIFGRKRRSTGMTARRLAIMRRFYMAKRMNDIDPQAEECMGRCDVCGPFLLGDQTVVIGEFCSDQLILDENTMKETMEDFQELYEANGHSQMGTTSILSKIEYNQMDFDPVTMSFGGVYVTAVLPSGSVRYPSAYRYRFQQKQLSAVEFADELIEKWGV